MTSLVTNATIKLITRQQHYRFTYATIRKLSSENKKPRRVVVTGLGVVSPVGCNVPSAWTNILSGFCGITKLSDERYDKLPCKVAGQITKDNLNVENIFSKTDMKSMAPSTMFALVAATEALNMSGWKPLTNIERQRTGVAVGVGMIDLEDVCETNDGLKNSYNKVSPFFVPRILTNMAAGQISIKFGFHGPNHSVSTACATGAHAIGDSYRFIKYGDADVMICGGAESCISPLSIAAFCRMRALSTSYNEQPTKASRPFDRDRDGFVMGEGAGILILEEWEHAKQRRAPIIAEVLGYGLSGDASHLTSPHEEGLGAKLAMQRAIHDANIVENQIGYINAHATSTPIGDEIEIRAIKSLFSEHAQHLAVSSTKGAHGHLLGSAGNVEAIFTVLACERGRLPPTINIDNVTKDMDLNFVANTSQMWKGPERRIALKNAFGFGGTNASVCIAEFVV